MEFKKLLIENLIPAGYNPRKKLKPGDSEFEKIKNSISEFGYVDPVIVNKDLTVIGGRQRISVLKTLGYTEIDCVVIDIDKTQEKALNVALNKISGEWDKTLLADLIKDLQSLDYDISFTGFELPEIDQLFNDVHSKEIKEDDFNVEKELTDPAITKTGDVWLLGRTGLTRSEAATVVANYFGSQVEYRGGTYDEYGVPDSNARIWKLVSDASIIPMKKVQGKLVSAEKLYSVELVSPILSYDDIEPLQELIRTLRKAGAVSDSKYGTGIHMHVDAKNHTRTA